MNISKRKVVQNIATWLVVLLLGVSLTGAARAAELAGTVVLATGAVSAVGADGQVRILGKGSELFSGDRIITASKSLGVLKMIDGQKISVRAESEIVITEYQFKGAQDDSSVVEFIKGGFRAITGAIGSQNPEAYKVRSDLSVIGIRGTEYLTRLCIVTDEVNSCERDLFELGGDKEGVPEGQYLFVTKGEMYMAKEVEAKTVEIIEISAGQIGFASDDELKIVPEVPVFLSGDTTLSPGGLADDVSPLLYFESCAI